METEVNKLARGHTSSKRQGWGFKALPFLHVPPPLVDRVSPGPSPPVRQHAQQAEVVALGTLG